MWKMFDKFTWLLDVDNVLLNIFFLILGLTFNILSLIMLHPKQRSHDKLRIKIPVTKCEFSYHAHTYNNFQATHWVNLFFQVVHILRPHCFCQHVLSNSSLQFISLLPGSNITVQFENALYWNLKWFLFFFFTHLERFCVVWSKPPIQFFHDCHFIIEIIYIFLQIINYFCGRQPKQECFSCRGYSA